MNEIYQQRCSVLRTCSCFCLIWLNEYDDNPRYCTCYAVSFFLVECRLYLNLSLYNISIDTWILLLCCKVMDDSTVGGCIARMEKVSRGVRVRSASSVIHWNLCSCSVLRETGDARTNKWVTILTIHDRSSDLQDSSTTGFCCQRLTGSIWRRVYVECCMLLATC